MQECPCNHFSPNDILSYVSRISFSYSLKGKSSERIIPIFSTIFFPVILVQFASKILISTFSLVHDSIVSVMSPPE